MILNIKVSWVHHREWGKDITLKDFYTVLIRIRLTLGMSRSNIYSYWNVIIESDQVMEWLGESPDDEEDKDESGMETD